MNWVERTYWLTDTKTGTARQAVVVEDGVEEILNLEEAGIDITPTTKLEPCASCPHVASCMESRWADSKRAGGPSSFLTPLSMVHTCRTCGDIVLAIPSPKKRLVTKSCPRWVSSFGSDMDCPACSTAKPCTLMADQNLLVTAHWIIGHLLEDAETRFPPLVHMDKKSRTSLLDQCLSGMYLALQSDPNDATGVVQEFMLEIANASSIQAEWLHKTAAERKFIRRIWEGITRQNLVRLRSAVA